MLTCLGFTVLKTRLTAGYCILFLSVPLNSDCAYHLVSLCWLWCSFTILEVIVNCYDGRKLFKLPACLMGWADSASFKGVTGSQGWRIEWEHSRPTLVTLSAVASQLKIVKDVDIKMGKVYAYFQCLVYWKYTWEAWPLWLCLIEKIILST